MAALGRKTSEEGFKLSAKQISKSEKHNPYFKERPVESSRPGKLLSANTFYVDVLKGIGKIYLHAVVYTYGSFAFNHINMINNGIARQATAVMLACGVVVDIKLGCRNGVEN